MADGAEEVFAAKAEQSLAGAESEYANGRYDNCANRCYYSCFQAAVAALIRAGIRPPGPEWGHGFVQREFVGQLINRRKLYPAELRDTLSRLVPLREKGDYEADQVTEAQAYRALRRARGFVATIRGGEAR